MGRGCRGRHDGADPVLIVDDDALVRAGLSMMLAGSEEVHVVREARDGAEVGAAVERLAPDVVLMDIRMPGVDGLAATEALRAAPPASCSRTRRRRSSCAIRLVAAGEAMLSPAITRRLIEHVADDGLAGRRAHAREHDGAPDRPRARGRRRNRAGQVERRDRRRALQKLELDNRVQVALLAHDAGAG